MTASAIDVFSHFTPRRLLDRYRRCAPDLPALNAFERLPALWDLDARRRVLDRFDGVAQVLCLGNPPVDMLADAPIAAGLARQGNELLAGICREDPERFVAFAASIPMADVELALVELDYAHDELGARGIQLYTHVNGRPLSDETLRPVFRAMAERDLPILLHPMRGADTADYATEDRSQAEIWFTYGWPYETTACAARLIHSGLFDELPDLKLVLHHMGGMIPFFAGRAALGFEQIFAGPGAVNPVAERAALRRPVLDYYHGLFADTALNGARAAVRCGHAFFGTERCLFGTDAPFSPDGGASFIEGALSAVRALELEPEAERQILSENARELLLLEPARAIGGEQ